MPFSPVVRMYVDENGHQALNGDLSLNDRRFLCITGVIMPIDEHDNHLVPMINSLKRDFFGSDTVVLHRRELISARPPFEALADDASRAAFNERFLSIVRDIRYRVISITIDKKALVDRFGLINAKDPYALALEFLLQRYQYWLQEYNKFVPGAHGDVLAESRGGGEDLITKNTYHEIYLGRGNTPLLDAERYLSSSQIKLQSKKANIAGLQFADLISHPARRYILSTYNLAENLKKSSFEQDIVEILVRSKFRKRNNSIIGAGIVLYPQNPSI